MRVTAVVVAVLAALAIWTVAEVVFHIHLRAPEGFGASGDIGALSVIVSSACFSLAGWGLLALLERLTARARLTERITIKDGVVEQSNFNNYEVPRMRDVPPISVDVISTDNPPSGIGQMATPVVAPAVSNAVAALTGARLRRTPMGPDRVVAALSGRGWP